MIFQSCWWALVFIEPTERRQSLDGTLTMFPCPACFCECLLLNLYAVLALWRTSHKFNVSLLFIHPDYVFTRNYLDNNRINLQHYLCADHFGSLIHPATPAQELSKARITNVGTCTAYLMRQRAPRISGGLHVRYEIHHIADIRELSQDLAYKSTIQATLNLSAGRPRRPL